jgi:hypothetical protein
MRQNNLIGQIRQDVNKRNVEQFRALDFDFLKPNSTNFIWKHSDKNKKLKGKVYFIWVKRGLYKMK